ncbi:MAG: efflux RND transporter periplasmic adaptor subunit, partial [Rhodospirillales bacterium]|nr:efflux RND transporter periplasmic adaptor subunit [Rhodospirillales bacterium]
MQNQLPFSRNLLCAIVAVLVAITGVAASGGALAQQGGPGAMSPDQRRAFFQSLSEEERSEFFSMSPEEKSKFIQSRAKQAGTKGSPAGGKPPAANGRRGPPPTLVQLGEVTREPMIKIFPITGRVVAIQRSEIAANIKGSVNRVLVEIGDRVKMGQVLAELNVDRLKLEAEFKAAEVLQARAKWKFAQAQVNLLKQELKRLERLRKSAAFSQARFEDKSQEIVKADASVDDTAAALSRARASRDLARIDLKDATIRAPFPGVILGKHVSPGTYLNAGTRIVTLLNDENVEIEVDIPSDRIGEIIDGKILTAWIDGKTKIEAAVRAVIPDENPLARTRAVRLTPNIEPTKIRLVPNQNVIVDVPGSNGGRDVIAVPKDAIVNQQSGRIVFVFADGRVRQARVEIGES